MDGKYCLLANFLEQSFSHLVFCCINVSNSCAVLQHKSFLAKYINLLLKDQIKSFIALAVSPSVTTRTIVQFCLALVYRPVVLVKHFKIKRQEKCDTNFLVITR